jgi:hypothetical protein
MQGLGHQRIRIVFGKDIKKKISPTKFIELLKVKNTKTVNIRWNSKDLTQKEYDENYESIKSLDVNLINDGYNCSVCDPFLFLVAELFEINIQFNFNGIKVLYLNKKVLPDNQKSTLRFHSNSGHFMCN